KLAGFVHELVERRRGEPDCGVLFQAEGSCDASRRSAAICLFFVRTIALGGGAQARAVLPRAAPGGRLRLAVLLGQLSRWHISPLSLLRVAIELAIPVPRLMYQRGRRDIRIANMRERRQKRLMRM